MFARALARTPARIAAPRVALMAVPAAAAAAVAAAAYTFSDGKLARPSTLSFVQRISAPQVAVAQSVPAGGIPGTIHERTFIAIKPDGVQRQLVAEIISRFEKKGYKLVGLKMIHPTKAFAEKHYDDLKSKPFFAGLVEYFSSGPVVAMVWEGADAAAGGRRILGETNPAESKPGSIRGDLCIHISRNVCHGSDSPESAQKEIELWFGDSVVDWESSQDKYLYEANPRL